MTVKEFALAVIDPEELTVLLAGTSYSLLSDYSGKVDDVMLGLLGDYIIADFKANEKDKYCVWIKEVPVKKEAIT